MAELTAKMVGGSNNATKDKPGTQHLGFRVWDREKPEEKFTLFRMKGHPAAFRDGKLSAWWEAVRTATHPFFDVVQDVEKLRGNPKIKGDLRPYTEVTGLKSEKAGFTELVTSKVTVPFDNIPYKWNEVQGAFCYDATTGKTLPLQKANVQYFIRALKIQLGNPDTVGTGEGGLPRLLWIPGVPDQDEELDQYEENLRKFEEMAGSPADPKTKAPEKPGKIVDWELYEVTDLVRR